MQSDCPGANWRDGTEVAVSWALMFFETFCYKQSLLAPRLRLVSSHSLSSEAVLFHQASCTWAASALPCTTTSLPRSTEGASFCGWRTRTRPAWCPGQRTTLSTCWSGQVRLAGKGLQSSPRSPEGEQGFLERGGRLCYLGWQVPPEQRLKLPEEKLQAVLRFLFLSRNLKSS